jgi:hypothetical protein
MHHRANDIAKPNERQTKIIESLVKPLYNQPEFGVFKA